MEVAIFEQLGQIGPVLHRIEIGRLIIRVAPETRTLVARAYYQSVYAVTVYQWRHIHVSTKAFKISFFLVAFPLDPLNPFVPVS